MNIYPRKAISAKPRHGAIAKKVNHKHSSRHKLFLLTWLAIYPLITIILHFFGKYLNLLPLPLRTLILTGVLVYLMTYLIMPMLLKAFRN